MKISLTINNKYSSGSARADFEIPEICPWCSVKISPTIESSTKYDTRFSNKEDLLSFILKCPNCKNHFIESYELSFVSDNSINKTSPIDEKPIPKSDFEYPAEIDKISEEFGKIINQSKQAEGMGLSHLAGIGYRKAIEFLIKDYLINHKKQDTETISKELLGKCIELLEDSRLKSLAKAATWIGNDETHYTRRHDSHDIEDMKKFLHSITLFISYELSINAAEEFISDN